MLTSLPSVSLSLSLSHSHLSTIYQLNSFFDGKKDDHLFSVGESITCRAKYQARKRLVYVREVCVRERKRKIERSRERERERESGGGGTETEETSRKQR